MSQQKINCPECGCEMELTEALTGQIESAVRAKYEAEAAEREKAYQAKLADFREQRKRLEDEKRGMSGSMRGVIWMVTGWFFRPVGA